MDSHKRLFLIIIILSFFLFAQVSFAQSDSNMTLQDDSHDELSVGESNDLHESDAKNKTVFIISDNPGTNIIDSACDEIYNQDGLSGFNMVVRSGDQIKNMGEEELHSLFDKSDAFIGEWISTDVDSVLTKLLGKYPELSHKELFLILEPPSGNVNSGSSSINLIRNNTINYNKIFTSCSDSDLIDYFKNTKRGLNFNDVNSYITSTGAKFDNVFNKMVLYKDINDKENLKNQILFTLNILGYDFTYKAPNFTGSKTYGIYRDRWYSLDEYIATFFNKSKTRTVGILESTMYIASQQLHPVNAIIESLESKGYNVIPVYAAGGSAEQLRAMVEAWTSAGGDISGFCVNGCLRCRR